MREFKFRAWDKENRVMVEVDMLGEAVLHIQGAEWENREDFIVMQSTGLKDKNGVEIYEGDILKHLTLAITLVKPVVFKWGGFGIESQYGESCHVTFGNLPEDQIGVIGNIHDNPELLTAAKEEGDK